MHYLQFKARGRGSSAQLIDVPPSPSSKKYQANRRKAVLDGIGEDYRQRSAEAYSTPSNRSSCNTAILGSSEIMAHQSASKENIGSIGLPVNENAFPCLLLEQEKRIGKRKAICLLEYGSEDEAEGATKRAEGKDTATTLLRGVDDTEDEIDDEELEKEEENKGDGQGCIDEVQGEEAGPKGRMSHIFAPHDPTLWAPLVPDRPTEEGARQRLGISGVQQGKVNGFRVQKISHLDGTFNFLLHKPQQPKSQVCNIETLIEAAFACQRSHLESSRRQDEDICDLFSKENEELFWEMAAEDGRSMLRAVVQGRVPSFLSALQQRPWRKASDERRGVYLLSGFIKQEGHIGYVGQARSFKRRWNEHEIHIGNRAREATKHPALIYNKYKQSEQKHMVCFSVLSCLGEDHDARIFNLFEAIWIVILQTFQGSAFWLSKCADHELPAVPIIGLNSIPGYVSGWSSTSVLRGLNPSLEDIRIDMAILRDEIESAMCITMLKSNYTDSQIRSAEELMAELKPIIQKKHTEYSAERARLLALGQLKMPIFKGRRPTDFKGFYDTRIPSAQMLNIFTEEELKAENFVVTARLHDGPAPSPWTNFLPILNPLQRAKVGRPSIILTYAGKTVFWVAPARVRRGKAFVKLLDLLASFVDRTEDQEEKERLAALLIRKGGRLNGLALKLYEGSLKARWDKCSDTFLVTISKNSRTLRLRLPKRSPLSCSAAADEKSLFLKLDFTSSAGFFARLTTKDEEQRRMFESIDLQFLDRGNIWTPIWGQLSLRAGEEVLDILIPACTEAWRFWLSFSHGSQPSLTSSRAITEPDRTYNGVVQDNSDEHAFFKIHRYTVSGSKGHGFSLLNARGSKLSPRLSLGLPVSLRARFVGEHYAGPPYGVDIKVEAQGRSREDSRLLLRKVGQDEWYTFGEWVRIKSIKSIPDKIWQECMKANAEVAARPGGKRRMI